MKAKLQIHFEKKCYLLTIKGPCQNFEDNTYFLDTLQSPLSILPHIKTEEHKNTAPLMSKIIARTNFHVASSVNYWEIINSICPLSKVVYIFDMLAPGVKLRPRRESGSTSPSSTWLHLIRRDAGEDVGVMLMLTDFPL